MSIANSASNKNYFVVAALEYQSLWNGIQKIRLSLEDITDHPCCEERDVKYSGYELERAILRKCYSTSVSSPCGTDVTTIGDNNLCIEAYDTSRRLFIQLSKELDGTVFGKRIRANIVKLLPSQHTEDSTNTEVVVANAEEKRLAITGRFFPYNSATGIIPFAGTKMCVKEVSNNKMGTGLNVWDGSYLL